MNEKNVIKEVNMILYHHTNHKYENLSEIMKASFLLLLLNVLTEGKTEHPTIYKNEKEMQKSLPNNFSKAEVVFNDQKKLLHNTEAFFQQLQLVFQKYQYKIIQINCEYLLLKLIKVIGSNYDMHFDNFTDLYQNNLIPKFVMNFFQITSIPNVNFSSNQLIDNINSVINFLKTKDKKFEILFFNFSSSFFEESSIILFFEHFLNSFFLKVPQKKLYERCASLFSLKYKYSDFNTFNELSSIDCFIELIHFLIEKNLHFNPKDFNTNNLENYFKKANVPMIIDTKILDKFHSYEIVRDLCFYQLQLIFNQLDTLAQSNNIYSIVENFAKLLIGPKISIHSETLKARSQFIKFQREKKKEKKSEDEEEKIQKNESENINENEIIIENNEILKDSKVYWNRFNNKKYGIDDCVLYEKSEEEEESNKHSKRKSVNTKSKVYKIFSYNESENNWIFNKDVFDDIKNSHYLGKDLHVPIFLFVNSKESELIALNSHIFDDSFPDLNSESEMFVRALFGKEKETKSIFLFLHVPQEKENLPNIQTIIYQIYVFLSVVSNVIISLINVQKNFDNQIKFINDFNLMTQNLISNGIDDKLKGLQMSFNSIKDNKENLFWNDPYIKSIYLNYNDRLNDHSIFEKLKNVSFKYFECHRIDTNDSDTFFNFLSSLNLCHNSEKILNLSEIEKIFSEFDISSISGTYLNLKTKSDTFQEEFQNIFNERFRMIKSKRKANKLSLLNELIKEILVFTPYFDVNFRNRCNSIVFSYLKKVAMKSFRKLIPELKRNVNEHLIKLKKTIDQKHYWNENQIENFTNSHILFLEEEYYRIIQKATIEPLYDSLFENNLETLEKMRNENIEKIQEIFKTYKEYIQIKNTLNTQDVNDVGRKQTNYVLKEKEINKQIKIVIDVNQLESEIEQDF